MIIIRLQPAFKALGKLYQLLAWENYYFRGGYRSQQEWLDYNKKVLLLKNHIKKLEYKILY